MPSQATTILLTIGHTKTYIKATQRIKLNHKQSNTSSYIYNILAKPHKVTKTKFY